LGCMTPKCTHQLYQRPQENDRKLGGNSNFWVGHWNFTTRIKYFKFKTGSKVSFPPPAAPSAHKAKLYFIAFPTSYLVDSVFNWVCNGPLGEPPGNPREG
jgi:hypothetical protein